MKTILPYIMVFVVALGCANTLPLQSQSEPILGHPVPMQKKESTPYENAAWHLFRNADYVRALRLAYHATEIRPQEPSAALLIGLIYDHGLDRPDLALSAYNHILQQAPHYEGVGILQPRLPYLFRRTQERVAQISLYQPESPPLQGIQLTIFPILPWTANKTDAAFALGLTDILFSPLLDNDSNLPSLRAHLLAHAFLNAFPNADANAFALWAGAEFTLSGTLIRSQNHHVSVRLKLVDSKGQTLQESPSITGNQSQLNEFRDALLYALGQMLDLANLDTQAPMPSSMALTLYGRALDAYLSGDPEQAQTSINGAADLSPNTKRINNLKSWISADYAGSQVGKDLVTLYRSLKQQPDPDEAATRRILATQHLLTPSYGLDSAQEALTPFRPPQLETTP